MRFRRFAALAGSPESEVSRLLVDEVMGAGDKQLSITSSRPSSLVGVLAKSVGIGTVGG